jgi:hypothetical protein
MKYFFATILVLLILGCTKKNQIEFSGIAPGVKDGALLIKDAQNNIICKENIRDEKFSLSKEWNSAGYYTLAIDKPGIGSFGFDVYLEPGTYKVTFNQQLYKYPEIETASQIQNELTTYYHLSDTVNKATFKRTHDLTVQMNDPKTKALPAPAYADLAARLKDAQQQETKPNALTAFVNKYPNNKIAMHILLNMDYRNDPVAYYSLYKKFSAEEKNSVWGKIVGNLLDSLTKPGLIKLPNQ